MKPTVFVAQPIAQAALDKLETSAEVIFGYGAHGVPLRDGMAAADAMIVRTVLVTAEDIGQAPSLKVIARHGVGVDSIDVAAATRHNILVMNTPDANLEAVAQHTLASILAVARRLLPADQLVRQGGFTDRDALMGIELAGRHLGIIGYGRIGRAVAGKLRAAFDMKVTVYDAMLPAGVVPDGADVRADHLDDLLKSSDVVSIHVPLTDETRGMIGQAALSQMRPGAILANMARGGVVDEHALAKAIASGHLGGAAIDVFEQEPPAADNPLFGLRNVVLTPHLAAHTEDAFHKMAMGAVDNVLNWLIRGEAPTCVNPEVLRSTQS